MKDVPINIMTSAVETVGGKSVIDDLILLTISPEMAYKRSLQKKKSDKHESLQTISKMIALYPTVINYLVRMERIRNWASLDTGTLNQNTIANNVYTRITGSK